VRAAGIQTAPLAEHPIEDALVLAGRVTFADMRVAHVFSPVSGGVVRVAVELGQRVAKGDVLAVIESSDVADPSPEVQKAQADLVAAEHAYKRMKALYDLHEVSPADLEAAEDDYKKAKAELARAQWRAGAMRAGANLADHTYTISAPMDGEVLVRSATPGMEVQGQSSEGVAVELFLVGETDPMWVFAEVAAATIPVVKVGASAKVRIAAYEGKTFDGRVDWVSAMVDPTTQTAKVRLTLDNHDKLLKAEMTTQVRVVIGQRSALALPRSALLRDEGTTVVVDLGPAPDGRERFARAHVEVDGDAAGDWVPVREGLAAGAQVVVVAAALKGRI
jgi:cobalt-zinc-cadmium efflux system membrane fusion protein